MTVFRRSPTLRCSTVLALAAPALAGLALAAPLPAGAQTWQRLGPSGGTIAVLAQAPSDSRVVYAGTAAGRVFRSGDGGASWRLATAGLPVLPVLALAVDPLRPEVVYAGDLDGVWKTVDGGEAWSSVTGSLGGRAITALAVDPGRPSTVYAGAAGPAVTGDNQTGGVFRSDDGGHSWVARRRGLPLDEGVVALALDPAAPETLLAATVFFDGGPAESYGGPGAFWKSTDGGRSWHQPQFVGLPDGSGPINLFRPFSGFASDPASHTLYAAIAPLLVGSSDFGDTWVVVGFDFQPSYVAAGAGRLYAITDTGSIVSSADGGSTWADTAQPAARVQFLAVDPRAPDRVLAGSVKGGLLQSLDGGARWSAANDGLLGSTITALAVDPRVPSTLWVGTDVGGLFGSVDGGAHWQTNDLGLSAELDRYARSITALSFGSGDGRKLLVGVYGGLARSTDRGASWSFFAIDTCSYPTAFAADPITPSLYAVTQAFSIRDCTLGCSLVVSRDGGATWDCAAQDAFYATGAVLVDPAEPRVVYVTGAFDTLFKSANRGRTFAALPVTNDSADQLLSLAMSPVDHQLLWAGTVQRGVVKSTTAGSAWSPASRGLPAGPIGALVADPRDAATVYTAVTGSGVYVSRDGGAHWHALGAGLPAATLTATLAIGGSGTRWTLFAGTAGDGLFALPLP